MTYTPALLAATLAIASALFSSTASAQPAEPEWEREIEPAPEPERELRPWQLDVLGAVGGGTTTSLQQVAVYAGYAHSLAPLGKNWDLFASAGIHLGIGQGRVDDPRGFDASVSFSRQSVGPEARLGFAYGRDELAGLFTFSYAPVLLSGSSVSDVLPERGAVLGHRAHFVMGWPGSWRTYGDLFMNGDDEEGESMFALLGLLLPNSIGINYETLPGPSQREERVGFVMGYSL